MIGRLLRTIALLSALSTATMPGLLAVAEGVIEATATAATAAHIEVAGGSESCPVAHDAHCAACSMLRHGHTGPAGLPDPWDLPLATDAVPRAPVLAAPSRLHSSGNPRAPPTG